MILNPNGLDHVLKTFKSSAMVVFVGPIVLVIEDFYKHTLLGLGFKFSKLNFTFHLPTDWLLDYVQSSNVKFKKRSLALAVVNERPTTYHNNNKVDAALTPCTMNDDVIFLGMNVEEIFSRRDLSPLPEVDWTLPPREDEFYGLKGAKVGVVEVVKAAAICSPVCATYSRLLSTNYHLIRICYIHP